jgi:hypothetical protein
MGGAAGSPPSAHGTDDCTVAAVLETAGIVDEAASGAGGSVGVDILGAAVTVVLAAVDPGRLASSPEHASSPSAVAMTNAEPIADRPGRLLPRCRSSRSR